METGIYEIIPFLSSLSRHYFQKTRSSDLLAFFKNRPERPKNGVFLNVYQRLTILFISARVQTRSKTRCSRADVDDGSASSTPGLEMARTRADLCVGLDRQSACDGALQWTMRIGKGGPHRWTMVKIKKWRRDHSPSSARPCRSGYPAARACGSIKKMRRESTRSSPPFASCRTVQGVLSLHKAI